MLAPTHKRAFILLQNYRNAAATGCLALSLLVTACATTTKSDTRDLLVFLDHAPVTKEDLLLHLGEANATFEQERVFAYRLSQDSSGYHLVKPGYQWDGVQYDLIVVLDEHNVVQRHSLVAIRIP